MPQDAIRAILLDVGGTLIRPEPSLGAIYQRTLASLSIHADPGAFQQASLETWAEFNAVVGRGRDRYSHFAGGEREFWRRYVGRLLERVSCGGSPDEAAARLHTVFSEPSAWSVFPDVRPALLALRERGLRLAVVSNWDSRLRGLLSALGLAEEFETITVSCEVGAEKPGRAIFQQALDSLRIEPAEALHVGDDPVSDYEGPRAAGIEAALLARRGEVPPGILSVTGLDRLPALLSDGASGTRRGVRRP